MKITSMKQFLISRVHSFRHAIHGWHYVLRTQRNTWIHSAIATAVFMVGLWLKISASDWAMIILTAALVFTAEFINTSIEVTVDLASPGTHPLAKIGKDVGAAAVLVAAMAAVLVGLLLLGPPLWQKLTTLITVN